MLSQENSRFKQYRKPPKIILTKYKYRVFLINSLILVMPKEIIIIISDIITFNKNKVIEFNFRKRKKILNAPKNDANNIR